MFQFVLCITALNYLWGKFHTDVNTISSHKKNLLSRKNIFHLRLRLTENNLRAEKIEGTLILINIIERFEKWSGRVW